MVCNPFYFTVSDFLPHVSHCIYTYRLDKSLCKICFPFSMVLATWSGWYHSLDEKLLLEIEVGVTWAILKPSKNYIVVLGALVVSNLRKGRILVGISLLLNKIYCQGIMKQGKFWIQLNGCNFVQIRGVVNGTYKATNRYDNENDIAVLLAPLCGMNFESDAGESVQTVKYLLRYNLMDKAVSKHSYTNDYTNFNFLSIIETRNI